MPKQTTKTTTKPAAVWGGARPGAGRPKKVRDDLDAGECRMLAELLGNSLFRGEYRDTHERLLRMADQRR